MLRTRDLAQTCIRLSADTKQVHVCEKDMQDMYWEIPKDQVLHGDGGDTVLHTLLFRGVGIGCSTG